jgi:hypothetical protein
MIDNKVSRTGTRNNRTGNIRNSSDRTLY